MKKEKEKEEEEEEEKEKEERRKKNVSTVQSKVVRLQKGSKRKIFQI